MSDKKIVDDEELEIDFIDDNYDSKNMDIDNHIEETGDLSLEEIDNDEETDSYGDETQEEPEEFEDFNDEPYNVDVPGKKKLTKEQIINRVMAGMGIAIAGFTVFYGCVAYGVLHKGGQNAVNSESESTTEVIQETTTMSVDENLFVSPYSDTNISDDVRKRLNDVKLKPMETGLYKLDNRVDNVISRTVSDSTKTTYEKVRNIYDYILYYFERTPKSYVDEDTVYEACSSMDYTSYYDMELIYRANKALTNNAGSSEDYACALTVLFRKLGLEAYYIDGERKTDIGYESHGYTLVLIGGERYIFDAAYEEELAENGEVSYEVFCKTFEELTDAYTDEGVEESIDEFAEFETLGTFSFKAVLSAENGDSATGSVQYEKGNSKDGNAVNASGDMTIYTDEKVYLSGSVTGSSRNTWKLIAKVYDSDMNYITESVLYSETTTSSTNEVSYLPGRAGNVRLVYMVTDENGRTCTISKTIAVKNRYVETTKSRETEPQSEETTTTAEIATEATTAQEPTTTVKPTDEDESTTPEESESSSTIKEPDEESTTTPYENRD